MITVDGTDESGNTSNILNTGPGYASMSFYAFTAYVVYS